jgi:hypothetical protein
MPLSEKQRPAPLYGASETRGAERSFRNYPEEGSKLSRRSAPTRLRGAAA